MQLKPKYFLRFCFILLCLKYKYAMGNIDLLKLYSQLKEMKQTQEVKQLRKQVEETLHYNLKHYHMELSSIGDVIGYDRLKNELQNAMNLIELVNKKKK